MNPSFVDNEGDETTVIYSSKLEYYQAEKKKVDLKIEFHLKEKKKIEESINKELPTIIDKAREKRKAEERDQDDLRLFKKQVGALTETPNI